MTEKLPGSKDASPPTREHTETEDLEVRRKAIVGQWETLMEEEQELIAHIDAEGSFDRLSEIIREQSILAEQLGAVEREISARQGVE